MGRLRSVWSLLALVQVFAQNAWTAVAQQPAPVGSPGSDEYQRIECEQQQAKYTPANTTDLFKSWIDGYDRFKRPNLAIQKPDSDTPAEKVSAGLYINQLWDFNEIDGTFMIQAYLTLGWHDPRLCFNDALMPGVGKDGNKSVELDLNNRVDITSGVDRLHELWLPDVNIENSIRLAGNVDPDADLFKVYSNGRIEWSRRFVVTLSADLDFEKLPFDTQFLYVNLESYRMPANDLVLEWDLQSFPHGLDKEFDNPEWEFFTQRQTEDDAAAAEKLSTYCGWDSAQEYDSKHPIRSHCDRRCKQLCEVNTRQYAGDTDEFSRLRFSMVLMRQTHSWVFGAIVPSVILCLISYLGLYIARDNPGRPGVHCVTILAHFTLDASMRTQIPHVGKAMWIDKFQTCECIFFITLLGDACYCSCTERVSIRLHAGRRIMLFSHLGLFLEYTVVHYSARQKYREQVITDAQLRKLMAFDEVAAEILGDPQLAAACGLIPSHNGGGLARRSTSAAGVDVDDPSSSVLTTTTLTSLSPQQLEQALALMAPEAKRIVQQKLRVARARLGGSVSEWGEVPEDFYRSSVGRRRWSKGKPPASELEQSKGLFGIGGRETIAGAGTGPLGIDQGMDVDAPDEELDDESGDLNVTPGRELPGTPDKKATRRRLREKDRSTTDHAIVGSLSEPLFGGSDGLQSGPPRLPGQVESPPVEELEIGRPDDDRVARSKECCGPRMRAKSRHFCNDFADW
jgi:hypothetical protein